MADIEQVEQQARELLAAGYGCDEYELAETEVRAAATILTATTLAHGRYGSARVPKPMVVPYGSDSGEKDYYYGYEKGYADGWNACRREVLGTDTAESTVPPQADQKGACKLALIADRIAALMALFGDLEEQAYRDRIAADLRALLPQGVVA